MYPPESTNLTQQFLESLGSISITEEVESSNLVWMNYFMATINPSIVQQTVVNVTHIPNTTKLASAFEQVFKQLFSIKLQLNAEDIFVPDRGYRAAGTAVVRRERVRMNTVMFALTGSILIYIMAVLVALFGWWRKGAQVGGHAPTSLAEMYVLLYASNAKKYCERGETMRERQRVWRGCMLADCLTKGVVKRGLGCIWRRR